MSRDYAFDVVTIHRWNPDCDGALCETNLRAKLEALGYEVCRYTYPPGTRFATHIHAVDKIDAVLHGRFRLVIGERELVLEDGDAVEVPAGVAHSAEVIGHQAVISLDAVRY